MITLILSSPGAALCPTCGAENTFDAWRDSDERGHFIDAQFVDGCGCEIDTAALVAAVETAVRTGEFFDA